MLRRALKYEAIVLAAGHVALCSASCAAQWGTRVPPANDHRYIASFLGRVILQGGYILNAAIMREE